MTRKYDLFHRVRNIVLLGCALTGFAIGCCKKVDPGSYVRIEPGSYMMGSPESERGRVEHREVPQHRVTITRGFSLKATEVTQGEWETLMGSNPSEFNECGSDCPVEKVSWYEAVAYCNALSVKEGLERCYKEGEKDYDMDSASRYVEPMWPRGVSCVGYRLPTEAEWEYAARAGATTAFHTGEITQPKGADPNLDKAGWYHENAGGKTHPVGQKAANAWGLYDMHGNVWEWVWDWYGNVRPEKRQDPIGPTLGSIRICRGGAWSTRAKNCRASARIGGRPSKHYDGYIGVRPARTLP